MNPLVEITRQGQALWLDYIRRNLFTSGELNRLVTDDALTGMTSNPTIFEKAIAGSSDYDEALRKLLASEAELSSQKMFDAIEIEDIRSAAEVLRPVYDGTGGADGFVSLEVSPGLAHDTAGTIAEAQRFWKAVDRPNVLIKVPATPEGIPAIEALLAEGINVNITLMFSLDHYEKVAQAFLRGAARCATPERIASVASFFVSRVDTKVDKALDAIGSADARALRGKIGIANCKQVYKRFRELFYGDAFAALRAKGVRVQRVLWASTGTKDPAYSDVMYLEELIGPDTVNTVPPATLKAFKDHGKVRGATVSDNVDAALAALQQLGKLGVELNNITEELLAEGVAAFSNSFAELLATLETKRRALEASGVDVESQSLGKLDSAVKQRLDAWQVGGFARRLWEKDPTIWAARDAPEITNRMGWLHLAEEMHEHIANLIGFREHVKADGFMHAVLLGMGGSSLAPEVFQETFHNVAGYSELIVLDSTHPAAVRAVEKRVDLEKTLFILSSKSGTTTEMLSFFYYFWKQVSAKTKMPGRQFIAITDPGTLLEKLARDRGFRAVFQANPNVGGRYSALSHFGLVPAAVIGVDLHRLLDRAWTMEEACTASVPAAENPGLILGAALGEAALAGRDKVTFLATPGIAAFPTWLEQLIAESTGKEGKGIIPVAGEVFGTPEIYGADRFFVSLRLAADDSKQPESEVAALEAAGYPVIRISLKETGDLGQEFFRWEFAVAAAGAVLGIQPFNQPDVQLAKDLAREAMKKAAAKTANWGNPGPEPTLASRGGQLCAALQEWLEMASAGDYIGIDAYLAPTSETSKALSAIRTLLRDRTKCATMLGYGPRFLHSTGQLHKGGPNTGLFLQLLDELQEDLAVPETDYTFGQLIKAQALGDYTALEQRKRRTLRVQLGKAAANGLEQIAEALRV